MRRVAGLLMGVSVHRASERCCWLRVFGEASGCIENRFLRFLFGRLGWGGDLLDSSTLRYGPGSLFARGLRGLVGGGSPGARRVGRGKTGDIERGSDRCYVFIVSLAP